MYDMKNKGEVFRRVSKGVSSGKEKMNQEISTGFQDLKSPVQLLKKKALRESETVQLAGDFTGIMPQHKTNDPETYQYNGQNKTDYTYHHIIPENYIKTIYQLLQNAQLLQAGNSVKTKSDEYIKKSRLWSMEVHIRDTLYFVNKEYPDIHMERGDIEPYCNQINGIINVEDLVRHLAQNKLQIHLTNWNIPQDNVPLNEQVDYQKVIQLNRLVSQYALSDNYDKYSNELEARMCWMPGNLHEGPQCDLRIQGKGQNGFQKLRDDGGDDFEYSAQNILNEDHYEAIQSLYKLMQDIEKLWTEIEKINDNIGDKRTYNKEEKVLHKKRNQLKTQLRVMAREMFDNMGEMTKGEYFTSFTPEISERWYYDEKVMKMRLKYIDEN